MTPGLILSKLHTINSVYKELTQKTNVTKNHPLLVITLILLVNILVHQLTITNEYNTKIIDKL